MNITPDTIVFYKNGFFEINQTIISSWIVMVVIIIAALLFRIFLTNGKGITKIQNFFEMFTMIMEDQVKSIGGGEKCFKYVFPFMSTLFLYILVSNLISLIPRFVSPTSSLTTTVALAMCVFIFSFIVGFKVKGIKFLKKYIEPTPVMLPLNIISSCSTVVSLSFRLYGNIMSSWIIINILMQIKFLSLVLPVFVNLLGTISGVIQAYIFMMLSMIFVSVKD